MLLSQGKQQIILKISWLYWAVLLLRAGVISLQHLWVLVPVVCVLMSPLQAFCAAVDSSEKPSNPRGASLHDSALEAQHILTRSYSDTAEVLFPRSGSFSGRREVTVWVWTFQEDMREGLHPGGQGLIKYDTTTGKWEQHNWHDTVL